MSKFKRHSRYDVTLAEQGVWFVVRDELDNEYGEFLCSLIDNHATHTKLRAQRALKGFRQQGKKADADTAKAELVVSLSLMDWKGVCYSGGKEVEFNRANAMEYLTEETFVTQALLEYAQNVANYQVATADDIAKN